MHRVITEWNVVSSRNWFQADWINTRLGVDQLFWKRNSTETRRSSGSTSVKTRDVALCFSCGNSSGHWHPLTYVYSSLLRPAFCFSFYFPVRPSFCTSVCMLVCVVCTCLRVCETRYSRPVTMVTAWSCFVCAVFKWTRGEDQWHWPRYTLKFSGTN